MKRMIFLAVLIAASSGCRGLNRIIDGPEPAEIPDKAIIVSGPQLGEAPNFDVPQPAGTTKVVHYGRMPSDFQIQVEPTAPVDVFVQDFSGFWFRLNTINHSGYIYKFDPISGVVEYYSNNPQLNLSLMKFYCVYQYVQEVNP